MHTKNPPPQNKSSTPLHSSSFYIYTNSIIFPKNSLFITFIKNVYQWSMKRNSILLQSLKKFNPSPPWFKKITPPPILPKGLLPIIKWPLPNLVFFQLTVERGISQNLASCHASLFCWVSWTVKLSQSWDQLECNGDKPHFKMV